MKKTLSIVLQISLLAIILANIYGCGKKEEEPEAEPESPVHELLVGSWNRYSNRVYTLLILRNNGSWTSDLRIEGGNSKIVERKGNATGTWDVDGNTLTFTVVDSQIENIWGKGQTYILEIVEIDKLKVVLRYPNARLITWKRSRIEKNTQTEGILNPVLPMKPLVVNINKLSSHDKDRYLCLALDLHLDEIPADAPPIKLHPRAWDAAILYLSSLIYNDVKTFDEMKIVNEKLINLLNPYLEGKLFSIEVNHVMISSSMEKVEEFIIEHSPPPPLETTGEEGENTGEEEKK
ncbi:conserved hypothetical protein [Desulfamplus magnetovallimortis]|uniref:Flagellar protein FliL n=1 Tax=Desulfamplus magnetovallimortis TaxID=1246637 RepID=A0A1W1HKS4_9BACT|nr:flagellar basal body-associated FliL family protein [Desulfamplus magnetovallimortis]SLM33069.1 conserved hypothetical protein [Desulfamplus magnetovallimortis]